LGYRRNCVQCWWRCYWWNVLRERVPRGRQRPCQRWHCTRYNRKRKSLL
jgi:hypothetical protein